MKPLIFILSSFLLFSCRPKEKTTGQAGNLPEDFTAFYQRFLTDSLFQMEHIVFPLEGIPDNADSALIAGGEFRWLPENWTMHKLVDPATSDFDIHFETFGEDIVTENLIHRSGQYALLRRFAKQGTEWNLIYYAGLNRLNQ